MVGLNVQLARAAEPGGSEHLALAEAIAHKALRHFAGRYELQPPAFNAIFFRNLLLLCDATGDAALRGAILDAMRGYADWAWGDRRDRRDCFQFASGGVTLLGQSAIVQVLALLAWDPQSYRRIG